MKYFYTCLVIGIFLMSAQTSMSQVLVNEDFNAFSGSSPWPANGYDGQWESTSIPAFSMEASQSCDGVSARGTLSSASTDPELVYHTQEATGEDIVVTFDYKLLQTASGSPTGVTDDFGQFEFQYSVNGGTSWTTYYTLDNTNHTSSSNCATLTHTLSSTDVPLGSDFAWRVLGDFTGAVTGADNYIYIDNFSAVEQVTCIQPVNIEVGDVTFDSIEVMWDDINTPSATEWNIAFCPSGIAPGSPVCADNIVMGVTSNPYTITGGVDPLEDGEVYDIYIQTVCGPGDESVWSGPISVQTVAIGTDCANAIEINNDPTTPVAGDLPFTHTSNTSIYDSSYSGSPGINCGAAGDYLDGNDVVYYYVPHDDDILQIELSGNLSGSVGVFVYTDCSDIGTECFDGATSSSGAFGVNDVFVTGGQDYYIVVSTTGAGSSTDYTLDITGFDCASWETPDGDAVYEFYNQTLANYDGTGIGVQPTINGAELTWYEDDNGAPGAEITDPSSITLQHNDVYWVKQSIGGCDSPFLMVTFEEFDCLGQLEILTIDESDSVCDSGNVTLGATANSDILYWYDAEFDGEVVGTGNSFTTPVINETTSYWVSEVFVGEGITAGQASVGPVTSNTYTTNNAGVLFTITEPITILDVQVYVTGAAGNMTVELIDVNGVLPPQQAVVGVPGGSTAMPTPVTIPLNFEVDPGTYRLLKVSGPSMMGTAAANTTFPYSIGTAGTVTNGSLSSSTSTIYYYFYNWTIIESQPLCESPREEVIATVHETIPVNITADDMIVCAGEATNITVQSTNNDYDYSWTWPGGNDTGAVINVSPTAPTTYSVHAIDPNTGCETFDEITILVKGTNEDLQISPNMASICTGQAIELTAGGIFQGFEGATNNWSITNSSSDVSAAWSLVSSPYTIDDYEISSQDNSQFYLSDARLDGSGSNLNTTLVSPSFNLVGVTNASLNFYYYYRNHPASTAYVDVSLDNGPWQLLESYNTNQGEAHSFESATISLDSYVDNEDVRVRFRYEGQWGHWWAIDNVNIKRNFNEGAITWSPIQDLYLNEEATIPYDGNPAQSVYFYSPNEDSFTYTATLTIENCGSDTQDITVDVIETPQPTADDEQWFEEDDTLLDLSVSGVDLIWYGENEFGELVEIPSNTELVHDTVYYVTQTLDFCESPMLPIHVFYNCPIITELEVLDVTGTTATIGWTEPDENFKIEHYDVRVIKESDEQIVWGVHKMLVGWNTVTVDGLEPMTNYIFEIFSICDGGNGVYSTTIEAIPFTTGELNSHDIDFMNFEYYPNPTSGIVNIYNSEPITSIEVYNIAGQRIMYDSGLGVTSQLNLSSFATGVYLVKINVGESTRMIRIIKE